MKVFGIGRHTWITSLRLPPWCEGASHEHERMAHSFKLLKLSHSQSPFGSRLAPFVLVNRLGVCTPLPACLGLRPGGSTAVIVTLGFALPGWGSALLAGTLGCCGALGALLVPKNGDVGVHTVCRWSVCLRGVFSSALHEPLEP